MAHVPARNRLSALDALANPGILFALLLLVAVRAFAGGATLAWEPVIHPSLAGYVVYYGPEAGNYTSNIDVGDTTSYAISNLVEGATYHFAATAYDAAHTQSAFSNDVSATVPHGVPVAHFSASTTSGIAPLALSFLNTSTGTISAYTWTFGDGTTSSAQSPSHVYFSEGVYTVSLTVTGPGGSNTQTNSNYITATNPVPSAPVAQFSASTTSGTAPLTVSFSNASTGTISAYVWTFGDDAISSAENPSHVYSSEGVYTVSLTVTGPGGSTTQTNSNYITVTGSTSLNVTPTSIAVGGTLTASWSGISVPTSTDWVGLFVPGAASSNYIDWIYVGCSTTPREPVPAGSCPFVLPNVAAGTYELRLLANNDFTVLATSNAIMVTP